MIPDENSNLHEIMKSARNGKYVGKYKTTLQVIKKSLQHITNYLKPKLII